LIQIKRALDGSRVRQQAVRKKSVATAMATNALAAAKPFTMVQMTLHDGITDALLGSI